MANKCRMPFELDVCCFHRPDKYSLYYLNAVPPGYAAGQFTAPLPTCPGDIFTFRCTVTGNVTGVTLWRVNGSSECLLPHSTLHNPRPCGTASGFTVTTGTGFGITNATSFSSTLSGTATSGLDGILVECFGPQFSRNAGNRVGNSSLQFLGQCLSFCITILLFK